MPYVIKNWETVGLREKAPDTIADTSSCKTCSPQLWCLVLRTHFPSPLVTIFRSLLQAYCCYLCWQNNARFKRKPISQVQSIMVLYCYPSCCPSPCCVMAGWRTCCATSLRWLRVSSAVPSFGIFGNVAVEQGIELQVTKSTQGAAQVRSAAQVPGLHRDSACDSTRHSFDSESGTQRGTFAFHEVHTATGDAQAISS